MLSFVATLVAPPAYYAEVSGSMESVVSGILSACAVPNTLADINEVVVSAPPEDRLIEETTLRAKHLLEEANAIAPIYLAASEVESFEGDLLIHWTTTNKRLTLISPREQDRPLKLYRRIANGWSELTPNPVANDLSSALLWVMQ